MILRHVPAFEAAVRDMRRLQREYTEASIKNSFRSELWTEKLAAEKRVDALLDQAERQGSLF